MNDCLSFLSGNLNVFFVANDCLSFLSDNLNGFIGRSSGYQHHDEDAGQETDVVEAMGNEDKDTDVVLPVETKDDPLEVPAHVEVKDATATLAQERKGASNTRAKRCLAS